MLAPAPARGQAGQSRGTSERGKLNRAAMGDIIREHSAKQIAKQFERERISLMPQIREDFSRMQVVNNQMLQAAFAAVRLDRKNILDATAEIRKRAGRLKTNLKLPAPEGSGEMTEASALPDDRALKESLLRLDRSIMSFVTNPLFQQTKVLDANLSTKASRDLEDIIELSRAIRKGVERLNRNPEPNGNPARQR
jgi:hypothetical protein